MSRAWTLSRVLGVWLVSLGVSLTVGVSVAGAAQGTVAQSTCPAPRVGQFSCSVQILVSRRTHEPIRPRVRRLPRNRRPHALGATGQPAPAPMTPAYLQQAYDLSYLSATRGGGDTVAIVGAYGDPTAAGDLAKFRATYGLPACTVASGCFTQLNEQGQASPLPATQSDWAQEQSMDIEAVSSLCPNCKIDLVEASTAEPQDLQAAITTAISAGANQVSISGAGLYSQDPFTNFSAPGVSILAATGDAGPVAPGLAAYPAALPYVTAVGGTRLSPDSAAAPTARGVTETAWSSSASGCDLQEQPLPYQPADGCAGRMYADVSADADPATGLTLYDSAAGGWFDGGGTSLATPLVAAFEAVTGVDGNTPQWAYSDAVNLNAPIPAASAGSAYAGPTGAGSISGQIVPGAPGIGLPPLGPASNKTYTARVTDTGAHLQGGVYPNGQATSYYWQYGTSAAYGQRTAPVSAGSGTDPVTALGHIFGLTPGTRYHYRLVATNASGTEYGYDFSFRTSGHHATLATLARKRRERAGRRHRRRHRRPLSGRQRRAARERRHRAARGARA